MIRSLFEKRILVEIIKADITEKKKLVVEGNKVIVRKSSRNDVGYKPSFSKDAILFYHYKPLWPLPRPRLLAQKVLLIEGAEKCVEWNWVKHGDEVTATVIQPQLDRLAIKNLFNADTVRNAGNINRKIEIPTLIYIIVGVSAVMSFLNFLVSTGRLVI